MNSIISIEDRITLVFLGAIKIYALFVKEGVDDLTFEMCVKTSRDIFAEVERQEQ